MSNRKLFFFSFLLTVGVMFVVIYVQREKPPVVLQLTKLEYNVFVTSQLKPENVSSLARHRIKTIVDIRPDGEESGQPSSSEIGEKAKQLQLDFHYIPVPHESIPEKAVTELNAVLSKDPGSTLLYCRTGRRAIRLFALAEACRDDGPNAEDLQDMVRIAGFSADDLKEDIAQRIAHRNSTPEVKK